jgi:hypothetical protein|tara:strand:- start:1638 stop:2078 length:441 start_codon:yes stop_codon:yes gene_type:complete
MCGENLRIVERERVDQIPGVGRSPGSVCASGSVASATISRKWTRRWRGEHRRVKRPPNDARLSRADGQEHLAAERLFEIGQIQLFFALVTEHFEHRRPAFFRNLDSRILQMHDVHPERLDQKILLVPAAGTTQRHSPLLCTGPDDQ